MKALLLFVALTLSVCASELRSIQVIPLTGVEGRIDHMAFDAPSGRLFVCALGNNTVEVIDVGWEKVIKTLAGFSEPQGVVFVPEFDLLAVANGGTGRVDFFKGTDFSPEGSLSLGGDADNVRYDAAHKCVIVGYGDGALAVIDAGTRKLIATIPVGKHPESFQIEPSGSRLYVNVPNAHAVSVVDLAKRKVTGSFSMGPVAGNFPMALDAADHRLFVACRTPGRLLVFNTETAANIATLPLHGDCDDVFYDNDRKQIYASCGEGFLDVFSQTDADHYALERAIPTASGARTSRFAGEKLYVAVPHRGPQAAELRVWTVR